MVRSELIHLLKSEQLLIMFLIQCIFSNSYCAHVKSLYVTYNYAHFFHDLFRRIGFQQTQKCICTTTSIGFPCLVIYWTKDARVISKKHYPQYPHYLSVYSSDNARTEYTTCSRPIPSRCMSHILLPSQGPFLFFQLHCRS